MNVGKKRRAPCVIHGGYKYYKELQPAERTVRLQYSINNSHPGGAKKEPKRVVAEREKNK
jgi:hypothetical protein